MNPIPWLRTKNGTQIFFRIAKKKILQYIFRICIFAVISVVFGLTVYTVNVKRVTGKKLVMPFNRTIAVVITGSMEPTIGVNDLIVIEKTDDYQVNDIVVFQDGTLIVVHRIISIEGEEIITAGDNNDGSLDDPIRESDIYGEVVDIIPFVGLILKIIKSPIGVLVIISTAILLLVLSYKREKEESDKSLDSIKEEIEKLKKELEK